MAMDSSQQQRKRASKSRNGCVNCKRRRVKCDETKPSCSRCSSRGDTCAYHIPQAWVFQPKTADGAQPSPFVNQYRQPPAPQHSLHSPTLDPSGDYALQFFRASLGQFSGEHSWICFLPGGIEERALPRVPQGSFGPFNVWMASSQWIYISADVEGDANLAIDCTIYTRDGGWWNLATITRHRTQEPAIINLLNALTTAWRASWDLNWAHNSQYETYYLQCLNKGMKGLVEDGRFQKPRASTLSSAIFVSCAELVRTGDINMPGPHYRVTRSMMNDLSKELRVADADERIEIGKVLAIAEVMLSGSRVFYDLPQADFTTRSPTMAADILDTIIRFYVIGIVRLEHIGKSWIESPEPSVVWGMLDTWRTSFQHFRQTVMAHEPEFEEVAQFMMMHFFLAQLVVRNDIRSSRRKIAPPLSIYDPSDDVMLFDRILDTADSLIKSGRVYELGKRYARYSGIIQPLFYSALRGKNAEIRRRATLLLASIQYSECDWNSRVAFRIAETMCGVFDNNTVTSARDPAAIFIIDSANCTFQTQDSGMRIATLELKYAMVADISSTQRIWQRKTISYWEQQDIEAFRVVSWPLTFTVKTFGYARSDTIPFMHGVTDTALRHLHESKRLDEIEQEHRPYSRFSDWISAIPAGRCSASSARSSPPSSTGYDTHSRSLASLQSSAGEYRGYR